MRFSALCALAACAGCVQAQGPHREVQTEGGVVRGAVGADYVAYLGVPYAAPPVGDNRFKDPLPPPTWEGVYEANRTAQCPYNGAGDEDCLLLHVFAPAEPRGEPSPVLVYIHGGSFIMGSGPTAGVEHLTREGLVVVTINHRLGVLGFLCLGTEDAPGNAGLKDQAAALRWVQRNIVGFGGDPRRVTLYGMSAGGASVDLQILSNTSKGLFRTAIVESGFASSIWATEPEPIVTAFNLAKALGLPETTSLNKLVKYYKEVPAERLSKISSDYYDSLIDGYFGFVPCVERKINNIEPFMTEPPLEILSKGNYEKIPMMVFFTSLEGFFARNPEYFDQNYKERMKENFTDFMPGDLVFDSVKHKQEIAQTVKQFYFGNGTIGDKIIEYVNYFGDYMILRSLMNSVEVHSKNNNPVYLMEFTYKDQLGSYVQFSKNITVAGHGDVVKHALLQRPIQSESDRRAVERLSKLIANFVKFGNPTPNQTELLPLTWPTYKPYGRYLHFDKQLQVLQLSQHPMTARLGIWEELYRKYKRIVKPVDPSPFLVSSGNEVWGSGKVISLLMFSLAIIVLLI